jgi:hypothetical protein
MPAKKRKQKTVYKAAIWTKIFCIGFTTEGLNFALVRDPALINFEFKELINYGTRFNTLPKNYRDMQYSELLTCLMRKNLIVVHKHTGIHINPCRFKSIGKGIKFVRRLEKMADWKLEETDKVLDLIYGADGMSGLRNQIETLYIEMTRNDNRF